MGFNWEKHHFFPSKGNKEQTRHVLVGTINFHLMLVAIRNLVELVRSRRRHGGVSYTPIEGPISCNGGRERRFLVHHNRGKHVRGLPVAGACWAPRLSGCRLPVACKPNQLVPRHGKRHVRETLSSGYDMTASRLNHCLLPKRLGLGLGLGLGFDARVRVIGLGLALGFLQP